MSDGPRIIESDGTVRVGSSVVPNDRWIIDIDDPDLTTIGIDHESRLRFGGTEIVLCSPFVLGGADGSFVLDPADRTALGPLLELFPGAVAAVYVSADCALHVEFVSGSSIVVPLSTGYEAWRVDGPGTRCIVSPLEGESRLSVWS